MTERGSHAPMATLTGKSLMIMKVLKPASAGPNPGRIRQLVEQLSEFIGGTF